MKVFVFSLLICLIFVASCNGGRVGLEFGSKYGCGTVGIQWDESKKVDVSVDYKLPDTIKACPGEDIVAKAAEIGKPFGAVPIKFSVIPLTTPDDLLKHTDDGGQK